MKLPIPSFGKKNKQKYILALLLRDEKISALVTEEVEGKMRVVGQYEEMLTTPLEKLDPENWLNILDRTISKAEETLPPNRETHDTVFGVKESWVDEKKIKKEYLLQLKRISEELALTPIGFLVISEAITHLIQAEEGVPVSAILVDIGKLTVTATLVRGGKVLQSKAVSREDSLTDSVETALKHFDAADVFPSRIILFSGSSPQGERDNIEHVAQKFISHQWSKQLPFLHAPQISVLNGGFDAKAVVEGAASQMGFEVLRATEKQDEDIKNFDHQDTPSTIKKSAHDEEVTANDSDEEAQAVEADAFGFTADNDVSENPPTRTTAETTPDRTAHHREVIQDEEEEKKREPEPKAFFDTQETERMTIDDEEDEEVKRSPIEKISSLFAALPVTNILSVFPLKKLPSVPDMPFLGRKTYLIPVALIIALFIGYFYYASNVTAEAVVYLKPNNVSETTDVTFIAGSGNDFSENIITATTIDVDIEGSVKTAATGKKDVGEKAKGTVTIYNSNDESKRLSAGTTIATDKGLKFTLDKDVTIASASGDIFSGTKPGTAQVTVTAEDSGNEYNLPSDTRFNVSGNANVAAKNDSAFSGGTKKEVTVVAKRDQDKLLADLTKSLQERAFSELEKKLSDDQVLIKLISRTTVSERKFNKKVDDEAKEVVLNGTVGFEALAYNKRNIEDFAKVALKNKYTDQLNLSDRGLTFSLQELKQADEDEVTSELTIEAGLIPNLALDTLKEQIQGKSVSEAHEILKKQAQVADAKVTLKPSIPLLPVSLPKQPDRITITTDLDE